MRFHPAAWKKQILIFALSLSWAVPARAAEPYKTYVLRRHGDWDIVCEQYTVKAGDHLWQILRRKGCIAERDFPMFVSILKGLNPGVSNVDRIYPGQDILIPLKQITAKEATPDGSPRYITIPIIPDVLYDTYVVRPGDCLSKIVTAQLGLRMEQIPEGYFETLKKLNPNVRDMNQIYTGQKIRIPDISSKTGSAAIDMPALATVPDTGLLSSADMPGSPEAAEEEWPRSAVPWAMRQMGGALLQSGYYFFPAGDNKEIMLNLSEYPLLEMADGRRLFLLESGKDLPQGAENVIRSFWESMSIVRLDRKATGAAVIDHILRTIYGEEIVKTLTIPEFENGIKLTLRGDWIFQRKDDRSGRLQRHCVTLVSHPEERTSPALKDYLAQKDILLSDLLPESMLDASSRPEGKAGEGGDRAVDSSQGEWKRPAVEIMDARNPKAYVARLAARCGRAYEQSAPLSFRYAGVQIQTAADIIHGSDGLDVVVDLGTFYGDTASAIEGGGLKVVSIKPEDDALAITRNLLDAMGVNYTEDPVFFAADREVFKTTSIAVNGLLALHTDMGKTLFATVPLSRKLCDFLIERHISVVKVKDR